MRSWKHAVRTVFCLSILLAALPAWPCGLPARPQFRPPCDGQSDRLFQVDRFSPNAQDEWTVFWYRLDDTDHSVYALKQHCTINPLLPPHSFVVLRLTNQPTIDGVYIIYNPNGLIDPD